MQQKTTFLQARTTFRRPQSTGRMHMLPSNILYWFGIYLATGVAALFTMRLLVSITEAPDQPSQWVKDVVQMVREVKHNANNWKKHLEKLIFLPLMLLLWPVAIVIVLFEIFRQDRWKPDPEAAFTCRRQHLVQVVTPEAAQAEAKVFDPLGRVPDLPFGHLTAGWCALLAGKQEMDELWYFEVPGNEPEPDDQQWPVPQGARRGYALVRSGEVRADFVFEWD
jgi:hypothetical protein